MPALVLVVTAGCLYRECVSWGDEQGSEFRVLLLPRPSLASVDGRMGLFLSLPGPLGRMGGRVLTLFCGLPSPGLALSAYSTRWWQGGIQSNCFVRSAVRNVKQFQQSLPLALRNDNAAAKIPIYHHQGVLFFA